MTLRNKILLVLTIILMWADPLHSQKVVAEHLGTVYAAAVPRDGSFLVLRKESNAIERYSNDGTLVQRYATDRTPPLVVRETLDFAIDSAGNIHALVISGPAKSSRACVVKFGDASTASIVNLDRPMAAYGLEIDELGNYYFLGVELSAIRELEQDQLEASAVKLIHKFSSNGSYVASFFQPKAEGKVSREELRRVTQCLYDNGNFVPLENGEMWFLYADKRSGVQSPFEWSRSLYRIDPGGGVTEIKPKPTEPGYELMAIHRHDSSLLFEWMSAKKLTNRIFTRPDGTLHAKGDLPGKLLALRGDTALLSTLYPRSGHQLTTWPLK